MSPDDLMTRLASSSSREDLDRDVAIQLRIARAVDLAHAAAPEERRDLIRTEARAGS